MNILLKNKLEEIEEYEKFECWYLVKQDTTFWKQCYYASILKEFNDDESLKDNFSNFEKYFEHRVNAINQSKDLELSKTHRAVRIGYYYGLITDLNKKFINYSDATVTDIYRVIESKTNGQFEKTELYSDIMRQQIEKIFISSDIDEQKDKNRKRFRIYPIMYLYKILIELGKFTGNYEISFDEYTYFVSTEGDYYNYIKSILLIELSRLEPEVFGQYEKFKGKLDNRFNLVLNQLDTIEVIDNKIRLKNDSIYYVSSLINKFEKVDIDYDYLKFLSENISFFEKIDKNDEYLKNDDIDKNDYKKNDYIQKIYFGAPGTGKSYNVSKLIAEEEGEYLSEYVYRTTIYPDYSYHDFIGHIMPVVEEDRITYDFKPGVFTQALEGALEYPNKDIYLVIEEMSRGNISSIFGDVFQLLDRTENGISEYEINNDVVYRYLEDKLSRGIWKTILPNQNKIKIPSNLNIIGTINTSDQNVFVMDNAFKRRFEFEYIDIKPIKDGNGCYLNNFEFTLEDLVSGIKLEFNWIDFYQSINYFIINNLQLPEDKQIGQFFIQFRKLDSSNVLDSYNFTQLKNKLLLYLWEDIHSIHLSSDKLFSDTYIKSFSETYDSFSRGICIFSQAFIDTYNKINNLE